MEELELIKSKITSSKVIGNKNGAAGSLNPPRIGSANATPHTSIKPVDKTMVKKKTGNTNDESTPQHI